MADTGSDDLELRLSEARLRALFEQSSDMIAVYDAAGRMVQMGEGIRQLGFEPEEARGTDPRPRIHPEDRERVDEALVEIFSVPGARAVIEYRFLDAGGGWRWLETIFTNRLDDPTVGGVIANTRDVTERREAADVLRHATLHDGLTGLPNRALLLDRLAHALERTKRTGALLAVLYADLDHFKQVNDTYGHGVGDDVLRAVAEELHAAVRAGDTAARLGGDEFVVVCEDVAADDEVDDIAARVVSALTQTIEVGGHRIRVGVSVGIASATEGDDPAAVLARADLAMYRAKSRGGDQASR